MDSDDASIVAKEHELAAELNEFERRKNEHTKLSDEAGALRRQIEDFDGDQEADQGKGEIEAFSCSWRTQMSGQERDGKRECM